MQNSAVIECGLREHKKRVTTAAISTAARTLTAEHGLNGYTVEGLCEQVGISRRTFFNYFPSKEHAVVGHADDALPQDVVAAFVNGPSNGPRPGLLDALVEMAMTIGERMATTGEEYRQFVEVLQKEPQLMTRLIGVSEERDRTVADLIIKREELTPNDPRALAAVAIIGLMVRRTTAEFFAPDNMRAYREILRTNTDAARYVFTS